MPQPFRDSLLGVWAMSAGPKGAARKALPYLEPDREEGRQRLQVEVKGTRLYGGSL